MVVRALLCVAGICAAVFAESQESCVEFVPCHNMSQSVSGWGRRVEVYWTGGAPGRAAAALLAATLTALGCQPCLRHGPPAMCQLSALSRTNISIVRVSVSIGWDGKPCGELKDGELTTTYPLDILRNAPVPLALRVYNAHANLSALSMNTDIVLVPDDVDEARALSCPGVTLTAMPRAMLADRLLTANYSFLFLDYAIWDDHDAVTLASTCETISICVAQLPDIMALRVISKFVFTNDPPLPRTVAAFSPELKNIREILALEATGLAVEQAVCRWAAQEDHKTSLERWVEAGVWNPTVWILLCHGDPDNNHYHQLTALVDQAVRNDTAHFKWQVQYEQKTINCSDPTAVNNLISISSVDVSWHNVMGVVARGDSALHASSEAETAKVPLVLYDATPQTSAQPLWTAAGSSEHLARALLKLLKECGWARFAVLSDGTQLADDLSLRLKKEHLMIREHRLSTADSIEVALTELRDVDARILVVNTGHDTAAAILTTAYDLGMTPEYGYAWVVREWRCNNSVPMSFYSVSLWRCGVSAGRGHAPGARVGRVTRDQWPPERWPLLATPFANALLSLLLGFRKLVDGRPRTMYTLHGKNIISEFTTTLESPPAIEGIDGEHLIYNGSRISEPLIHVAEWSSDGYKSLATWRMRYNETIDEPGVINSGVYPPLNPVSDGRSQCLLPAGDPFTPRCLTPWAVVAGTFAALALGALGYARCALRVWLARRDTVTWLGVLTRHEADTTALLALLVDRAALVWREELGAGRFGYVRLATLSGRAVAVKALREGATPSEERELLREAITLAGLDHAHVVKLVGVCAADGPPLLLMEHALFGDLHRYLRARRPLLDRPPDDQSDDLSAATEAVHVSPEALTRLAREAASALGYLTHRGIVHRDVRAANCLVDGRRRLKLADFGMARETQAAAVDRLAEYACRRRALLPVLWMAPESLTRGVFSAASDVWALGVLVLELVTLGERPYGCWSPLTVMHYVTAGGRPELPLDASPQTRGVCLSCWQRRASRRCSAAELVAYLAAHPAALRPALLPAPPPPPPPTHTQLYEETTVD